MQPKTVLSLAALAFGATLVAGPALAQNSARIMNDGGFQASSPGQASGTVQPQQQRQAVPRRGTRITPTADVYGLGDYPGGPGSGGPMSGYSYGGYYDYAPGVFSPAGAAGGATASACAARFRSYDPASGTFLGFDGRRHPCP
ncbi:MAG TPA: BA14K family protein [Xanthobacteraceae bacterium]|jgi:hypothetical protein